MINDAYLIVQLWGSPNTYTYERGEVGISVGDFAVVPVRDRYTVGKVVGSTNEAPNFATKKIVSRVWVP